MKDKLARLTKASKNLTMRLQHQVIVEKRWSVFEGENAHFVLRRGDQGGARCAHEDSRCEQHQAQGDGARLRLP